MNQQKEVRKQYREALVGDFIEVPSKNSDIPLFAGEVTRIEEDPRKVYFGQCWGESGHYLMEHDGQIGVFR